jgi:isoquinoline 1-oxidoreductase alpha subunit
MITLLINKKKYNIEADSEMPLLWAIRDIIGLTGTKYGCGTGACGSCKVIVDQEVIYSCLTPVSTVVGKQITTIEGTTENLQLLQNAWEKFNVPQCGFCQPGQLIAATFLLNSNEKPTDTDIDDAMSGNICRCGTYQRIKEAIHYAVEHKKS